MKRFFALATVSILAIMSVGTVGCASHNGSQADASTLKGTSWYLVAYGSGFWHTPLVPLTKITLTFYETGPVARGKAGINLYGADYVLSGDRITLSRVTSTDMSGFPPVIQQEKRYLKLLAESESFTVSESRLTIYCSSGNELQFWRD